MIAALKQLEELEMRKDDTQYVINVTYDIDRQEFMATFDSYQGAPDSDCTYGAGDTKGEALMNLIENARKWELEE